MANSTEIMQWLVSRIDEIEQKRESLTKERFNREFNPRLRELKHLIEECADGKCPNEDSGLHLQNVSGMLDWGSKGLIGFAKERFKQLKHKGWDWRSFYNGWLEGRVDMLAEIKGWKSNYR